MNNCSNKKFPFFFDHFWEGPDIIWGHKRGGRCEKDKRECPQQKCALIPFPIYLFQGSMGGRAGEQLDYQCGKKLGKVMSGVEEASSSGGRKPFVFNKVIPSNIVVGITKKKKQRGKHQPPLSLKSHFNEI